MLFRGYLKAALVFAFAFSGLSATGPSGAANADQKPSCQKERGTPCKGNGPCGNNDAQG